MTYFVILSQSMGLGGGFLMTIYIKDVSKLYLCNKECYLIKLT